MPKRIFVYFRNISENAQSVRSKPMATVRYLDDLPCAPGGHVQVQNGTFVIAPGQIVRVPCEFSMAGGLHKRPFLVHVTREDFEAAANMKFDDLAQEMADKAAAEAEVGDDSTSPPNGAPAVTGKAWTHTYKGLAARVTAEGSDARRGPVVTIECDDGSTRKLNQKTWDEQAAPIEDASAD